MFLISALEFFIVHTRVTHHYLFFPHWRQEKWKRVVVGSVGMYKVRRYGALLRTSTVLDRRERRHGYGRRQDRTLSGFSIQDVLPRVNALGESQKPDFRHRVSRLVFLSTVLTS